MMRVGDELLGDRVASVDVGGGDANRESVVVDVLKLVLEVSLLFAAECFAVGEEQFHVTRLRAVDGRVVNLVECSMRYREPDAAGGCIGSRDGVFAAGGPARFDTGGTESGTIIIEPAVRGNKFTHLAY